MMVVAFYSHGQWSPSVLTKARYAVSATSVGSKAFFAGGDNNKQAFNIIDIYDAEKETWSIDSLSMSRVDLAAAACGSKVFFAGGFTGSDFSKTVDIYDNATNQWERSNLSEARSELSAVSNGDLVFFAGGRRAGGVEWSNVVDIYNTTTNKWEKSTLSEPRSKLAAASVGSKVFFGGGIGLRNAPSDVVDIYDIGTNTWSVHHLSRKRYDLAATSLGSKVFFAGGLTVTGESDIVDIYDISTNTWTTQHLSKGRFDLAATSVGTSVIFAGGHMSSTSTTSNAVDIYDNNTGAWTISMLSEARNSIGATSVGNKALFAGGWANLFAGASNVVDIFNVDKLKDVDPPEIKIVYGNQHEGKIEVSIHVWDNSRIAYVSLNNSETIKGEQKDSLSIVRHFKPGEEISVKARDDFNNVIGMSFVVTPLLHNTTSKPTKVKRKYYALLIAIQDYNDQSIAPLNDPIKDAMLLKEVLTKKYTFEEEDIAFVKNATFEDINIAFENLSEKINADDLLLIFYAGHGFFDEKTNIGYWLPADAVETSKSKWFRNSALVENIRAINSKHTLLIADACFSGGIFKTRAPFNNGSLNINNLLKRTSRKALTSGSLTTVPDKSVFMKYLIKILDENPNLYLPSEDLYMEIRQAMKNNTTTRPEYGEIQNTGDEGGNFVFQRRK